MGIDISILTDKENLRREAFNYYLSRTFLRLVFRQHDDDDEEINQISIISGVDLKPLLEMHIPDISYLEYQLEEEEDLEKIASIQSEIGQIVSSYSKDINLVIDTLQKLDARLKATPAYYKQLRLRDAEDNYIDYFRNYSVEVPDNYGITNFGADIRILLNFLIFAKSKGATKAYFSFG